MPVTGSTQSLIIIFPETGSTISAVHPMEFPGKVVTATSC